MNPERAHFCVGCGMELERQCNSCGKQVPGDARFCPYCGQPVLTAPPVPWTERYFSPEARQALFSVTRSIGITLLVLAFVVAILTPPPRIIDELILLLAGASALVFSEILRWGRKPKPPGGYRPPLPDSPPPGGIEVIPPDEVVESEARPARQSLHPGSTQGPYLN